MIKVTLCAEPWRLGWSSIGTGPRASLLHLPASVIQDKIFRNAEAEKSGKEMNCSLRVMPTSPAKEVCIVQEKMGETPLTRSLSLLSVHCI